MSGLTNNANQQALDRIEAKEREASLKIRKGGEVITLPKIKAKLGFIKKGRVGIYKTNKGIQLELPTGMDSTSFNMWKARHQDLLDELRLINDETWAKMSKLHSDA